MACCIKIKNGFKPLEQISKKINQAIRNPGIDQLTLKKTWAYCEISGEIWVKNGRYTWWYYSACQPQNV